MLVRVGGLRLVRELVELYLSYAPARLQEARRAAEQGDSAGVRRACHALRSGSAQLGLVATARHCLAAERGDGDPAGLPALVREIERAHGEGMAWLTRHLESLEAA